MSRQQLLDNGAGLGRQGRPVSSLNLDASASPAAAAVLSASTDYTTLSNGDGRVPPPPSGGSRRGPSGPEGTVDRGFEGASSHIGFDKGEIVWREGHNILDDNTLAQINQQSAPYGCCAAMATFFGLVFCFICPLFWPYLYSKLWLVRKGEIIAVQWMNGSVRVLGQGLWLWDTFGCSVRRFTLTDDTITFGVLNIVRIRPSELGKATINGRPILMRPGVHVEMDPLFTYNGSCDVAEAVIHHGAAHLVTIPRGRIGLAVVAGVPHFLGEGPHHVNNPRFTWVGFKNATDEWIKLGSKNRIMVRAGRLGLVRRNGLPVILNPGQTHFIDDPTLDYIGSVSVQCSYVRHGSIQLITVQEGAYGVSFRDGQLAILNPARHTLDNPTHRFAGFLNSGQQTLSISQLALLSGDNVGLELDAAVTVQIVDPSIAVPTLGGDTLAEFVSADEQGAGITRRDSGGDNVYQGIMVGGALVKNAPRSVTVPPVSDVNRVICNNVVERAKLALAIIVGANSMHTQQEALRHHATSHRRQQEQLASGGSGGAVHHGPSASAPGAEVEGQAEAEDDGRPGARGKGNSYKELVHASFMQSFSVDLARTAGVAVIDMSIEDMRIQNPQIAEAMSQGAVARTQLVRAEVEAGVLRRQAEAQRAAAIVKAEGEAGAMRLMAEAEAERIRKVDEALRDVAEVTRQRELMRASGEAIGNSRSTVILSNSMTGLGQVLAGGNAQALGALTRGED